MNEEDYHKIIQERIEYMLRRYGSAPSFHAGGYVAPPGPPAQPKPGYGGWYDQGGYIAQRDAQMISREILERMMRGPVDPYAVIDSTEVGQRLKAEAAALYAERQAKISEASDLLKQANEIDDLRRDLSKLDVSELEGLEGAPREWIEAFARGGL